MKNQNKIMIILFILFILIFIIIHILNNTSNLSSFTVCPSLNIYEVKSVNVSTMVDKVLVIGGVHGNEPAPAFAIEDFYNSKLNNLIGNITFIPKVNAEGIKQNTRYLPCHSNLFISYDINRHFKHNQQLNAFQSNLVKIIDKHDFILDFHEAYDFHKVNNKSVGSCILPGINYSDKTIYPKLLDICNYLKHKINFTITDKSKKFSVIKSDKYNIENTLRDYCEKANKPYILIEITGQNNKQHLKLRKKQTINILKHFFQKLNMYVST